MKIKIFILVLLISFNISLQAQEEKIAEELPNTIENLFKNTYKKATDWKEFKMIKRTEYRVFQKTVLDSVTQLKKNIAVKVTEIKKQQKSITSLNTKINTLDEEVNVLNTTESTKNNLKNILFGVIGGLLLALSVFIFKFSKSNKTTKKVNKLLVETEEELEVNRKNSIEREQKLRRQLQDEINKQRGV